MHGAHYVTGDSMYKRIPFVPFIGKENMCLHVFF